MAVLEAQAVGWGASGRNGGIVSPAFACGGEAIEARVGREAARALHRLTIEGVERLRATIADLGITGADPVAGLLNLRRFDRADDLHAYAAEFAGDFGYDFTYLNREAIRARLSAIAANAFAITQRSTDGISTPVQPCCPLVPGSAPGSSRKRQIGLAR